MRLSLPLLVACFTGIADNSVRAEPCVGDLTMTPARALELLPRTPTRIRCQGGEVNGGVRVGADQVEFGGSGVHLEFKFFRDGMFIAHQTLRAIAGGMDITPALSQLRQGWSLSLLGSAHVLGVSNTGAIFHFDHSPRPIAVSFIVADALTGQRRFITCVFRHEP